MPNWCSNRRFNPLDRGNSNQISMYWVWVNEYYLMGFNPLDRGNSNQMHCADHVCAAHNSVSFQSPRSGKF